MSHSLLLILFLLTVWSFSIFGCKEYNQSDFSVDHLVMSMCLLLCCWKGVFAMTSAFSWQNSVSLCPASFCTPRPNLPVTPGVSCLQSFPASGSFPASQLFTSSGQSTGVSASELVPPVSRLQRYPLYVGHALAVVFFKQKQWLCWTIYMLLPQIP